MTDLRTRIIAAIYAAVIPTPPESVVEQVADAVIRELGLIDGDALTEFVSDIQTAFDIGTADD